MLSYEAALQRLLDAATPMARTQRIDSVEALGRVLAEPVVADMNVPPCDNSAMDGYAVRVSDLAVATARLPVSQRIPAGAVPTSLVAGTAARIFTGAPIPPGADAVVMQERCTAEGDFVHIAHAAKPGENIRRAGEDVARGATLLAVGQLLRAQDMGLAASVGVAALTVYERLRVAVFFTGDELVMPGQPLPPGSIYNSNRYVLRGLLQQMGCAVSDLGIVPDDLAATRAALRNAAREHDVVITCGGVSVGEEDHVKAAVMAEGSLDVWKIAIKPGKPLAFGSVGEASFIGLPGNPVSAFVTFLTLVKPFLRKRQGAATCVPTPITMRADFAWTKADARREFLRVKRNAQGGLDLFSHQGSGVLTSCAWGDGLIDNAPNVQIAPGDAVAYLPFEG